METQFYTYTSKEDKLQTLLLKGLDKEYKPEEVLDLLKHYELPNVNFINVSRLETTKSKLKGWILPIYIVQLSADSNKTGVHAVKHLDHHKITWDYLRRSEITQCKNCQRFNHTAANCSMAYRCVKCDKTHGPNNCLLEKKDDDRSKLFCTLCQKYGHPANYKGCPKYKEFKNKNAQTGKKDNRGNNEIINENPATIRVREYPTVRPDRSYADTFKNRQPTSSNPEFMTVLGAMQQQIVSIANIARQNSEKILQMFQMFQNNFNNINHG